MTSQYKELGAGGRDLVGAFTFALLGLFAALSLIIVIMSAKAYKTISGNADVNNAIRTTLSYVAGKVRAYDSVDSVSVENTKEGNMLVLSEWIDGKEYETYIYFRDGMIREYFTRANRSWNPDLGDALVEAAGLDFSLYDRLLVVTVTDQKGAEHSLRLYLQSDDGKACA